MKAPTPLVEYRIMFLLEQHILVCCFHQGHHTKHYKQHLNQVVKKQKKRKQGGTNNKKIPNCVSSINGHVTSGK